MPTPRRKRLAWPSLMPTIMMLLSTTERLAHLSSGHWSLLAMHHRTTTTSVPACLVLASVGTPALPCHSDGRVGACQYVTTQTSKTGGDSAPPGQFSSLLATGLERFHKPLVVRYVPLLPTLDQPPRSVPHVTFETTTMALVSHRRTSSREFSQAEQYRSGPSQPFGECRR